MTFEKVYGASFIMTYRKLCTGLDAKRLIGTVFWIVQKGHKEDAKKHCGLTFVTCRQRHWAPVQAFLLQH